MTVVGMWCVCVPYHITVSFPFLVLKRNNFLHMLEYFFGNSRKRTQCIMPNTNREKKKKQVSRYSLSSIFHVLFSVRSNNLNGSDKTTPMYLVPSLKPSEEEEKMHQMINYEMIVLVFIFIYCYINLVIVMQFGRCIFWWMYGEYFEAYVHKCLDCITHTSRV